MDTTDDGVVGNTTHASKLLFLDAQVLSAPGLHGGAEFELQTPEKLGRVIIPEYEWEMWELGGYDTWLQLPNVRLRLSPLHACAIGCMIAKHKHFKFPTVAK